MSTPLVIKNSTIDSSTVLSPQSDIDMARAPAMRDAIKQALTTKPSRLVIDLSVVDYVDSSGIATLVEALKWTREANIALSLAGLRPRVKTLLEITKLSAMFTTRTTVEEACKA
jgi:anti-sigma B factor antagonist